MVKWHSGTTVIQTIKKQISVECILDSPCEGKMTLRDENDQTSHLSIFILDSPCEGKMQIER